MSAGAGIPVPKSSERGHSGPEAGILAPSPGTGLRRFRHPVFQFSVTHHPTYLSLPTPPVLPWSERESNGSSGAPDQTSGRFRHCAGDDVGGAVGCTLKGRCRKVCVPLRHFWIAVTEYLLHFIQSASTIYQKRCIVMPTAMRRPVL